MKIKTTILIFCISVLGSLVVEGRIFPEGTTDNSSTDVVVYPNPITDGTVTIRTDLEIDKIEIVSVVGQVVYTEELESSKSAQLILGQVQSGIYLMRISFTNNSSVTKRIWVK